MVWSINDEHHRPIYDDLEAQSDRGAAIVGAALLDRRLEEIIRIRLVEDQITEDLLNQTQALSSFGVKINLAFSLGLYGEKIRRDLDLIRRIRNEFAHFERPLNFEDDSVANRCSELVLPKEYTINNQPVAPKRPRDQFLRAVNIISSLIWNATQDNTYERVDGPSADLP